MFWTVHTNIIVVIINNIPIVNVNLIAQTNTLVVLNRETLHTQLVNRCNIFCIKYTFESSIPGIQLLLEIHNKTPSVLLNIATGRYLKFWRSNFRFSLLKIDCEILRFLCKSLTVYIVLKRRTIPYNPLVRWHNG